MVQFADPRALTGAISDFIPSAFKYPSFTRHFCRRTLSSKSAKARVIVCCSGRAFSRSSTWAVPRGSFANSTIFPQSAGGIILTTADGFPIFLYGQKAHPILFFSSAFTNCAIHSSVFSPDSPARSAHHNVRENQCIAVARFRLAPSSTCGTYIRRWHRKVCRRPKSSRPTARHREREYGEHQSVVSRPT